MNYWLLKTEPESFSYDDLVRLGQDKWDGVKNFAALKNMRDMAQGDRAFIYHTGKEKAVVGVAEILNTAYPDPQETNPLFTLVDVAPLYKLNLPVTLKTIKADPIFKDWDLVRLSRLSIMPVSPLYWDLVHDLGKTPKQ